MTLPANYHIVCDYPGHPTEESARDTLDEIVRDLPLVGIFRQSMASEEVPVWCFSNMDKDHFINFMGWFEYTPETPN